MNPIIQIAPVHKSFVVNADPATAFAVFTAGLDRWWPKSHHLATSPARQCIIEPFVGGRWYVKCEDDSESVVGHIQVWEPGERFGCSWEINSSWKPDARVAYTSEIEVRFLPDGDGRTRVELEHRNFERMGTPDGDTMRTSVDNGWPAILALFVKEVGVGTPASTLHASQC